MAEIKIFGYTDKLSVKQGEKIDFHVSADGTKTAKAQLVKLIHGDEHPDGPGYIDQEIDNKRIFNSIKLSGLENFIKNLPNGYETYVGASGLKLSGGQIQRICIARAIYLQPSVFILDEATSSLDQKTERDILDDFNKLKSDKFLIMVSHRLTSLKHCDKVFYILNGEIKDSGKIEDLIKRNPKLIN